MKILLLFILSTVAFAGRPDKPLDTNPNITQEQKDAYMTNYAKAARANNPDTIEFYVGKCFEMAKELKDDRFFINACNLRANCWYKKDYNKYAEAVTFCREQELARGIYSKAFMKYMSQTTYAASEGLIHESIRVNLEMHDKAIEYDYPHALVRSYSVMGKNFYLRRDYTAAKKSFRMALATANKYEDYLLLSRIYFNLSRCYPNDPDSSFVYSTLALDAASDKSDSLAALSGIGKYYAKKGLRKQFYDCLAVADEVARSQYHSNNDYKELLMYDAVLRKDWKTAESIASDFEERLVPKRMKYIAEQKGDQDMAYKYACRIIEMRDSLDCTTTSSDLFEMNAAIMEDNQRIIKMQKEANIRTVILGFLILIIVIIVLFSVFIIINNRKEIARQKEFNEKLRDASSAKEKLLQNVSHEIRTPLNAVVGFSQLLSLPDNMTSEEDKQSYLKYIINNAEVLTMLIDDMILASDTQKGNYIIKLANSNVTDICERSIAGMSHKCPGAVALLYENEIREPLSIYTDPLRMQQVLGNLISNAIKHTDTGSITLRSYMEGSDIMFSVTDTGSGIPEDKAEEIFERFTKLERNAPGAGLGLNICKTIIEQLGGSVILDTSYKQGARFIVRLPIHNQTA